MHKMKNPLINFNKVKFRKKELFNKSNNLISHNMIFNNPSNQKVLKTFKKEISNDKNKLSQMKYKTSKNSPNSSLNYSNRGRKISSREFSKKDIIINKTSSTKFISCSKNKNKVKNDLFEEYIKKKMKRLYKKSSNIGAEGQISQRQKSIKNIFNSIRNDSSLNSSRLSKIKKTIYGNSNVYFNNHKFNSQICNINCINENRSKINHNTINKSGLNSINSSSLIPSCTSVKKIIINNNNSKAINNAFCKNFVNKQKVNNRMNNEKGYIGNYNLMRHIENKYENKGINNESNNNFINKNIEKHFIKKYKNYSSKSKIDDLSNSKIKKLNPVDYLYNSKHKNEISKYAIKYIDGTKNNNIVSFEANGSYIELNNQNKTTNLSKNNSNNNSIVKKKLINNEIKNNEHNDDNNSIGYFNNKIKINKENLNNILNQENKNNIFDDIYGLPKNNSLLSEKYLFNNNVNINKNTEINSLINNGDKNNNSLINISNNNKYNNINNQHININININNTDNKNDFNNNNFIDINNISKRISNISSYINPININDNNDNEVINNKSIHNEKIINNDLIYQKKIAIIPKEFASLNTSKNISKEEFSNINNKNSDINNYNNYNNYKHPASLRTKLIKKAIKMNDFKSPNKNNEMINIKNEENSIKENDVNKDKKNIKNKNIFLEKDYFDINMNDFSPIYDEKCKGDNIQEKIKNINQLIHINSNNVSLIDNKNNKKEDINKNNNINDYKSKIKNKDEFKKKQDYHKNSQSQSFGKKVKDINKKIINNLYNANMLKLKNNIILKNINNLENGDISKSKLETNSEIQEKVTTNKHQLNNDINKNNENKEMHLLDLLESKENSKEYKDNNPKKEKENNKKIIFTKKLDIFSLKINNNITENNSNNNKNKIKELNEKINNNYNDDMLCAPDSSKLRKKEQDNIILTTMSKDCDYYKEEKEKLSEYIKEYYEKYGKYPDSRIEFYLYGRQIGHGAFGKVNLALHIASGRLVAIKIFAKKHLKNKYAKHKIKNEINILSRLRHPFINHILDSFETDKYIFIVMEYVCGDLLGFIRKRGKLSESISKLIFKQIIEGLKYIHKKKIVHRDIKLDNILIDLTNTVKICDFGVSKRLSNGDVMYDHCGTPAYIAPEIFRNKGYEGYLCDVWSAGVTLYYMLSGVQPFRANSIKDLERIVIKGKFEEIEEISKEANDLIREMLQVDPKNRITIDQILKHPWLNNVNLENRKNLNLFTESEKILLSKFDVDYLSSNKDELIENFSLKNLETNNNDTSYKNVGNTKSVIFAPYNSYIEESQENNNKYMLEEEKIYKELEIHNNICKFGFKVQQANIKYELSNNNDFDNGVIKTQKEEDIKNQNEKIEKNEEKILKDKISGLNTPRVRSANDSFEETEKIIVKKEIIKKIENEVGYDRKYIINSIRKNKINYAMATYYLLARDY